MKPFDAADPSSWPITLTVAEIAQIYRRTPSAVRKSSQRHQFHPAPFKGPRPYLWRRVDVMRDVEGARGISSLRKAG